MVHTTSVLVPHGALSSDYSPTGMGRKLWGGGCAVSLFCRGIAGSPSNSVSPAPRSNSVQSGVLVYTAIWPQQTWYHGPIIGGAVPPLGLGLHLTQCVGVLWPNGWMDQDETWRAGRPRPWPNRVKWDPAPPPPPCSHLATTDMGR